VIDALEPPIRRATEALDRLRHPVLLLIRVAWGFPLMLNGWGKLHHLSEIAQWFGDELGIPFPFPNAVAAALTELLGGLLLLVGLGSRGAAFAVLFTMSVAYLTSDRSALATLATDPFCDQGTALGDCFTLAAPFPYWFAALLILSFGAGLFSIDGALGAWWERRKR
jgi:putative oxidoreductase